MIGPMVKRADEVTGLLPSEKAVLHRLCLDADGRRGDTTPLTAKDLAKFTGLSDRAIRLARSKLSAQGLILLVSRPGEYPQTIVDPKPVLADEHRSSKQPKREPLPVAPETRQRVFERDAYRCRMCDGHRNLTIDHIMPRSAGGSDDDGNLQTLCRPCNSKKGAKVP